MIRSSRLLNLLCICSIPIHNFFIFLLISFVFSTGGNISSNFSFQISISLELGPKIGSTSISSSLLELLEWIEPAVVGLELAVVGREEAEVLGLD